MNVPYATYTEAAFSLFESFLSESVDINGAPDPGGCNYGVVRQNAKLNLVGVSDEPEQSVNTYGYYVSFPRLENQP